MNIITCSAYMYMYNNSGIWAASLLSKMNYVKCRGTTKPRCLPEKFDKIKEQFLQDILTTVVMEEMPCELIISWDLTGPRIILDDGAVWYKASGNCWFGGHQRQVTAVMGGMLTGDFPPQLIYTGKTPA